MAYIDYNLQFSTENKLPMKDPNYGKSIYDPIEQSEEGPLAGTIAIIITLVVLTFLEILFNKKDIKTSDKKTIKTFENNYKVQLEPYVRKYIENFEIMNNEIKTINNSLFDSIRNKYNIVSIEDKTSDVYTSDFIDKNKISISKDLANVLSDIYEIYLKTGEANSISIIEPIYVVTFDRNISNNDIKQINTILKRYRLKTSTLSYSPISSNSGKIDIYHKCENIDTLQMCKEINDSITSTLLI